MRYCSSCKKLTAGEAPFCNFCGRSFGFRICPRGHKNTRASEACSECGSTELSTPAPRNGSVQLAKLVGVGLLAMLCAYAVYFAWQLVVNSGGLFSAMRLGVELGVVFLLWMLVFGNKIKR